MKEITTVWIQSNKEAYRADAKNSIYEEEYAKKYISDIEFNKEKAKLQPFEFSVDISTMEATAQGNAGRCWIVAGLNLLREYIVKEFRKGTPQSANFQLSLGYLCFWDKLEKANCFLEKAIQYRNESYNKREVYSWFQYAVTDGGFWTNFKELVKKYGIVPAEIMPETFQSSNTEEMNDRLNYYLRKISAEIRKAALEGQNIENIVEIKEQALKKVFTFLCRCYGCPPDTFTYTFEDEKQKKQYTPKAFYNDFAGEFLDQFVNIISLPYEKLPFGETCVLTDVFQVVGGQEEQFLNLPLYELKEKCIEQLKDGIPVVCMADDDKMCMEELQLWDDNSFDYVDVTGFDFEMSRKDYFQLKAGIASHSMMLTGVHLGEDGMPERWKIENSYGTDGLHKGYYICSDSWFEKYVISAVISKKYILEISSKKQQNKHLFNIWDIM